MFFRRAKAQKNQTQITINGAGLTGTTDVRPCANTTQQEGGWYQRPTGDDRRSTLNTNDLRGKIVKVKVKDTITAADANKADYAAPAPARTRSRRATCTRSSAGAPQARTKAEVYAMGFRNPYRIQVDRTTSPTSPTTRRTPTRRSAAVARPASAAWRSSASRPTTAIRCATRASSATTSGTSTSSLPGTTTAGFMGVNPEP